MKKAGLLIVFLFIFAYSAYALETTKISGLVVPNSEVKLVLDYAANSVSITGQGITKISDNLGLWSHTLLSDAGNIDLTATYNGEEKTFIFPAGQNFEVKFTGAAIAESEETTTAEAEENTTVETAETTKETETKVTGKSLFSFESLKGNTFLLIIGLFVFIVIANIVSAVIINKIRAWSSGSQ